MMESKSDYVKTQANRGAATMESSSRFPPNNETVNSHRRNYRNDPMDDDRSCVTINDQSNFVNLTKFFNDTELEKIQGALGVTDLSPVPVLLGAVILERKDIALTLLSNGHPVDSFAQDRSTPLMWAVRNKNLEIINVLLKYDADPTLLDDNTNNVALIAIQCPTWDQNDFLDFWKSISCRMNPNHPNVQGNTIFHYAIKRQWNVLLEQILKTEANVHCENIEGITPLTMAAIKVDRSSVSTLLRIHADITQADSRGCTTLCYSAAPTMQKTLETPHLPVQKFVETVQTKDTNSTMESYLKEFVPENCDATISYLSTLFEEIISSYRSNWYRDRELGYPGYTGGQGNLGTTSVKEQKKIKAEEIARLNAILPKLEDTYIQKLTDSWLSLISKIRQTASKRYKKLVTLIQIHLLSYQVSVEHDAGRSTGKVVGQPMDVERCSKIGDLPDNMTKETTTEAYCQSMTKQS